MENLNVNELNAVASQLSADPEKYVNDPTIEHRWAIKAYQHAETYFNLLSAIDTELLRLTKHDEQIYKHFRSEFESLKVDVIDEDELKSKESKEKWRPFCETPEYKEKIEDYNFATLLRIDSTKDYTEENTTLVPRIQFYAIEIARNREGHNKQIKAAFKEASKFIEQ